MKFRMTQAEANEIMREINCDEWVPDNEGDLPMCRLARKRRTELRGHFPAQDQCVSCIFDAKSCARMTTKGLLKLLDLGGYTWEYEKPKT